MSDVLDLFVELAAIPSPQGEERAVADRVAGYMRDLGLPVEEDDAAERVGGTMGNLYARLEPTAEGTPLFLCAHMDTVPPDGELEPVVEDGIARNAGGTILGCDNKAGVQITRRNQVFRQLECKDADGTIPDNGIRGTADSKDRG